VRPVLFDTSIYVSALRTEGAELALRRLSGNAALWLSSVVLEELYAGAGIQARRVLERLEHDFEKARRILIPNLTDWTQAGKVLSLIGARYGYEEIGKARLTNDALIAMSAARLGMLVITANARDFARLAVFRSFQWRLETLVG